MVEVCSRLPRRLWVTNETLRCYETGAIPETKTNPIVVVAIASALGVSIKDLSPFVASEADQVDDLLRTRCILGVAC